jgi:hypothetical protein
MNQLLKSLLLVFGIGSGLPCCIPHPQCLQGREGTTQTWLTRHLRLIHCGGEATGVGNAFKRFAPGTLMRGGQQDAVNVENCRRQGPRLRRSRFRRFKDSHDVFALLPLGRDLKAI